MLLFILLSLNIWLYSWTHWPSTGFKESPFKNRFITQYDTIFRLDWLGQAGKWRFILYCWPVLRKLRGTILGTSLENSLETHTLTANTQWISLQELIDSGTKSKCHISSKTFTLEDNSIQCTQKKKSPTSNFWTLGGLCSTHLGMRTGYLCGQHGNSP